MQRISKILATLVYYLVCLISLLPMPILYFFGDIVYLIAHYLVRYRREVIIQNLSRSFPEKKYKEIHRISRLYMRHMIGVFVEMCKYFTASKKFMKERLLLENPELLEPCRNEGRNVVFMLGHYGNWELFSALPLYLNGYPFYGLFKKQKSDISNMLSLKMRTRWGSHLIPAKESVRFILNNKSNPSIYAFIADQSPAPVNSVVGTFLNQPTLAFAGAEKLSRPLKAVVFYLEITPMGKRGHYTGRLVPMTGVPSITQEYLHLMEKNIQKAPQYWLWSHKRWKHNVPEANDPKF